MVKIIGPKDPKDKKAINVTSCSTDFGKALSPMILGPVNIPNRGIAKKVENAWQYSKVYSNHIDKDGNPTTQWYLWSKKGYMANRGERYPMGKGSVPEYSFWNGEKLDYLTAREKIYIPIYTEAARCTWAYKNLLDIYKTKGEVLLWDFDGYDYITMNKTLEDCVKDPSRPLGHSFVLALMLTGEV
jgi:hypothetical protein